MTRYGGQNLKHEFWLLHQPLVSPIYSNRCNLQRQIFIDRLLGLFTQEIHISSCINVSVSWRICDMLVTLCIRLLSTVSRDINFSSGPDRGRMGFWTHYDLIFFCMRENGHPSAHFLVCLASPEDLVSIAVQDIPGWDTQDFQMVSTSVREDPYQLLSPTFGHCPLGGSKRLPRWFGALI